MKVPIQILPAEFNGASSPRLARPLKASAQDLKSPDEKLDEQFSRAKDLSKDLERTRLELERRQQSLEEEKTKKSIDLVAELNVIEQVKVLLKEKQPDLEKLVNISLMQERSKYERQNEKVLQILKMKDSQINELRQKVLAAESALQVAVKEKEQVGNDFKRLQEQYELTLRSEIKLKQNVDEHEETLKLLSENHEQLRMTLRNGATPKDYEREITILRQQLESLTLQSRREREALSKELNEAQAKLQELSIREAYVLEFANRQEEFKKEQLNEVNKKVEELNIAIKNLEEVKGINKQLEIQLENEINKSTELEINLNTTKELNEQLKSQIARLKETYNSDNEKLESVAQLLNIESKDKIGRIKIKIEELQYKLNELKTNKEILESRLKLAEETAITQQTDKVNLVNKYTEEISYLQKALLKAENKSNKITKQTEVQTALKGSNISDLNHMIGDYKEKLEFVEQQREEREKYIAELECELRKEAQKAKDDLEVVIRKYEENKSSLNKLDENEVVSKLNSRVSALQIQVHQLQAKLKEAEDQLSRKRKGEENQVDEGSRSTIAEHVAERMEILELTIVQLREEIIQLEVSKHNIEQSYTLELEKQNAKIKALENTLNTSNPSITSKAEIEQLKEMHKVIEERVKNSKEDYIKVHKELIRLKQIERLSNVLPSDGEITLKLTNKIKAQKIEVKKVKGLLKRAKIEFDKMTVILQSRGDVSAKESKEFNWESFVNTRYEQKIQELINQCKEYKKRLNESLKLSLQLKEEFIHKIMDNEENNQKQLLKLVEEIRLKSKEAQNLSQKVGKLTDKVQVQELELAEQEESKGKAITDLNTRVKQLEEKLKEEKHKADQIHNQVKKQEVIIQERSAQISVLMETVEVLQNNIKDELAQKYMNANSELCSLRSNNTKLEVKLADLNFMMKNMQTSINRYEDNELKLQQEKELMKEEMVKLKKVIEFQGKEIEKLEKEREDNCLEKINEVAKSQALIDQIAIKEKRIEVLKAQLSDNHNKELTTKEIVVKEKKAVESKELLVMIKELLASSNTSNTTLQKLCDIILKADKTIQELEREKAEIEQQLEEARTKANETNIFELLSTKCSILGFENTELQLLLEMLITVKTNTVLEESFKQNNEVNKLRNSLYRAHGQLIELAAENNELKATLSEAQNHLEMKVKEMQLARVKLEKEQAIYKVKTEEEASLKLTIRNEEIKTYFDTTIAKLILDKDNDFTLAKEICAQKLLIEKLQYTIDNLNKEKSALEVQSNELMVMLNRQMEELAELHAFNYSKYKKKQKIFSELITGLNNTKELPYEKSKKVLQLALDKKVMEMIEVNNDLARLKEENAKLKLQLSSQKINGELESMNGRIFDELSSKITNLSNEIVRKDKIIEDVEKKAKEIKAECNLEMKSLKSDLQLQLQNERRKIMEEYANLEKKYKPGEAPGEILADNKNLHRSCITLKQVVENLESEIVVLRQKLDSINEDAIHYKDEAELYKKALYDIDDKNGIKNLKGDSNILSTPSVSSRSKVLNSEKRSKESKKKLQTSVATDKFQKVEEEEIPRIPKLIKAMLQAKCNEAEAEKRVRKLAREELETRKQLTNTQTQLKDLESKLRHYERLLKDNNIDTNYTYQDEEERLLWMKRRILELEATCEDLRTKEITNLTQYTSNNDNIDTELDENTTNLLLNGIVSLCNRLAIQEAHNVSVERVQRLIIKTLTSFIRKLQGDITWNLQCAVPSNKKDRKVWYLELAEMQSQRVEEAVHKLKEYTSRIAIEVTGSFSSAAQVKAASMELANQTKEVAEEAASLKAVCNLVRVDMKVKSVVTDKENIKELKANLREKKNTSVILVPNKDEHDREIEILKGEIGKLMKEKTLIESEMSGLRSKNTLLDKKISAEIEKSDQLNNDIADSEKKLLEANSLLEERKRIHDKAIRELTEKIEELKKNIEEEKERMKILNIENKELRAKCLVLNKKLESVEEIKKLQEENKELDAKLQKEIYARKIDIELWVKERQELHELIEQLKAKKRKNIKAKKEASDVLSDSETMKGGKNKGKLKKLKEELVTKSEELFKANSQLRDLSSKLALSELNEKGKLTETIMTQSIAESDMNYKMEKERLEQEKTRLEEECNKEREKMIAVIQELDHELKLVAYELTTQRNRYEEEISNIIRIKDKDIQILNVQCRELDNNFMRAIEDLNAARSDIESLKTEIQSKELMNKEIIEKKEEQISRLKDALMTIGEEHNKAISELKEEFKTTKASKEELISIYEHQLKMLKDKFREECGELNSKMTSQLQAKEMINPKKKEEDFISSIAQVAQKEAQIKHLEKEYAKIESKLAKTKAKLQSDSKKKSKDPSKIKVSAKNSIETTNSINENVEDHVRSYNNVLKKKAELELKLERVQNLLKGTECKLITEKEKAKEMTGRNEEMKKELEIIREQLKASKKEQNDIIKRHKNELQKVLDDLSQMKRDWRSPEELNKCIEEKQELENQVKTLKEELNRKKELIKQWKEKEEVRQSETGQLMNEVESIKDDSERLKRTTKELTRKDQIIRSLKAAAENSKVQEKQLTEDNKILIEKVKLLKNELTRKDVALKAFKERSEEIKTDRDIVKEKEVEIEKVKAKVVSLKQEIERKDDQIKVLKSKIDSLMQETTKLKSELDSKSKE